MHNTMSCDSGLTSTCVALVVMQSSLAKSFHLESRALVWQYTTDQCRSLPVSRGKDIITETSSHTSVCLYIALHSLEREASCWAFQQRCTPQPWREERTSQATSWPKIALDRQSASIHLRKHNHSSWFETTYTSQCQTDANQTFRPNLGFSSVVTNNIWQGW